MSSPTVADVTFSFNCFRDDISFEDRCAAAAAAGFTWIGLSCRWMNAWMQDHDLAEADVLLGRYGFKVGELEAIRVMTEKPDPLEETAAILAEHFRPLRLQAIGPYEGTLEDAARRAGRVADRFGQWDVDVVLEPLPFTNMQTPADAAQIILLADRPNLSMCMDIWHLYRNGLTLEALDGLWPTISTLQLNDGLIESEFPADLREDCLRNRRLLGHGEFDLRGLLREGRAHRPDATFSIEIINTGLREQDAMVTAQQIADSITEVVAASHV